jgi:hypothetical protein
MEQRALEGRIAFLSATAAVALAGAFTVWVLTAPAYNTGQTVLEANPGFGHALSIAVPLVVTVVAWVLLHLACRFDWSRARAAARVLAWLLLACALISGFSIGLFFMPAAVVLILAASLTPVRD